MAIYLSKVQFSLAILKPNFHLQHQSPILIGNIKTQFSLATSKPPIFIGNIKTQFSLAISKAQLTLALLKAQANYLALFYQKPKVINSWKKNNIS